MKDSSDFASILVAARATEEKACGALDALAKRLRRLPISDEAFTQLIIEIELAASPLWRRALICKRKLPVEIRRRARPGPRHALTGVAISWVRFDRLRAAGIDADAALQRAQKARLPTL